MLQDIIVIDDIFDDVDVLAGFASKQKYKPNTTNTYKWSGVRTKELHEIDQEVAKNISQYIFNKTFASIKPFNVQFNSQVELYFHKLDKNEKYDSSWVHTDYSVYAGVVYLNKKPKKNSGTVITRNGKEEKIENKYNRLVLYNSEYPHAPMRGFGAEDKSRLTLSIFINSINVGLSR